MLKHAQGDLLQMAREGQFDAVVHGCNCFCTMGSGIARQVREQYPSAYQADCKTVGGDIRKLGNYTFTFAENDDQNIKHNFMIINAYTQYDFNRSGERNDVFEYTSFELILRKLAHNTENFRFGFPYIGMGLAGGDKIRIVALIEDFAQKISKTGGSVTLVEFKPGSLI